MGGEVSGRPWRAGAIRALLVIGIAAGAVAIGNSTILVTAAETPPEIRQAERNDPAAGEVVIINRKSKAKAKTTDDAANAGEASRRAKRDDRTERAAAPDPYAPRRAAPDDASPSQKPAKADAAKAKPQRRGSSSPQATTAKKPAPTRDHAASRPATTKPSPPTPADDRATREERAVVLPPPPHYNTEPRPAHIRREAEPDARRTAGHTPRQPARRFDDDQEDAIRSSRRAGRVRDDALYPPPGYRPRWRDDRRYAERVPRWRDDEDLRYRRVRRPWRVCRRLAWRCRDGFERACWRWQRQCR